MGSFVIEGAAAEIRYGYLVAARLGHWRCELGHVRAAIIEASPVRLNQSGLVFVWKQPGHSKGAERPIEAVHVNGSTIVLRLGQRAK